MNDFAPTTALQRKVQRLAFVKHGMTYQPKMRGRVSRKMKQRSGVSENSNEEERPTKRPHKYLTTNDKKEMIDLHLRFKATPEDLAAKFGCAESTAGKIIKSWRDTGVAPTTKKPGVEKGTSKFTMEQKVFVAMCFVVGVSVTEDQVCQMFNHHWPKVGISKASVGRIRKEAGITLKSVRVRKKRWNIPESIVEREAYVNWYFENRMKYRFVYYDEANYGVTHHRRFGYALIGVDAILEKSERNKGESRA